MPSVSRGAMWTVYLVMMMDTLNFGIVFPLLPSIAKEFGAGATMASLMATSYSFCQMVATPILGRISDRVGRRPVILISLIGTALSSFGTALCWNFPLLVVSRCLNGISGATPGVVNAYIADVTNKEEKPEYMAYSSVANAVGIIVGPALGGLLSRYGFSTACSVSGVLSSLNLLVALLILKESRWEQARDITVSLRESPIGGIEEGEIAPQRATTVSPAQSGAGRADGPAADHRQQESRSSSDESVPRIPCAAGFLFVVGFFLILGFAAIESIVPYFLMDRFFDGDANRAGQYCGIVYTLVGIEIMIMGGLVYKRAVKILGMQLAVLVGAIIRTACFFLQAYAPTPTFFAVSLIFCDAGSQFIIPTATALLTTMCHRSAYGRALGYYQGMQAFSRVLGPAAFGWGYDHLTHEFSFLACAATTVIAAICFFLAHASQPVSPPPLPQDLQRVEGGGAPERGLDRAPLEWRSPSLPEAPSELDRAEGGGARGSSDSNSAGSEGPAAERGGGAAERAKPMDLESSSEAQSCVSTPSAWTDASSTAS